MSAETADAAAQLLTLARRLADKEGARRTAGRLFNVAALLLAEMGISDTDLEKNLRLAFLRFDTERLYSDSGRH